MTEKLSGALTGLTRVRRFCQDDAHVFCREDQIKQEVIAALEFMKYVYGIFGMSYKVGVEGGMRWGGGGGGGVGGLVSPGCSVTK